MEIPKPPSSGRVEGRNTSSVLIPKSRPGNPGRFLWISPDCWSLPKGLEFCQLVMIALTHSQNRAEVQVDKSRASSGRRLMCSRDPAEVEALQNEFFKAGIAVATR